MIQSLKGKLKGVRVLLRADLNIPYDIKTKQITDFSRINRITPTIQFLKNEGAKIILISHLGRPNGKKEQGYSLEFLAKPLGEIFDIDITFLGECVSEQAIKASKAIADSSILLLENLRFHAGEEENSDDFSKALSLLCDNIYINDAFSCSHRKHASIYGICNYAKPFAGLFFQEEVQNLRNLISCNDGKVTAIVGGKKVSTKFKVLDFLSRQVDNIVISGAMANTFMKAYGINIGSSIYEEDFLQQSLKISDRCNVILPQDVTCARKHGDNFMDVKIFTRDNIPQDYTILDIHDNSIKNIQTCLERSKMVLWNGPVGMFEDKRFAHGTFSIANIISNLTQEQKIKSIVGGGDTISAIAKSGAKHFTYLSTAGGAFLEWLEKGKLDIEDVLLN